MAMLDATFSCLENAVINTCVFGTDPQRVGNSHPTSVPFGTFPTSDGEIIITCSRDPAFYSLCRALGREDMVEDPRFSKAEARRQHKAELTEEISRFTRARTLDECERIFEAHGVPNGRINTMKMIWCGPPDRGPQYDRRGGAPGGWNISDGGQPAEIRKLPGYHL